MTLDDLVAYGADVQEGLERCMGMEDLYLQLVGTVRDEERFEALCRAIKADDLDTAFSLAHALKGVLTNLAITPLADPMVQITELLRARTKTDYTPLLDTIMAEWKRFCAL